MKSMLMAVVLVLACGDNKPVGDDGGGPGQDAGADKTMAADSGMDAAKADGSLGIPGASCSSNGECRSGYCDSTGHCERVKDGAVCTVNDDCDSGWCPTETKRCHRACCSACETWDGSECALMKKCTETCYGCTSQGFCMCRTFCN